ncbi:isoleucine--tRNA ligase [Prevotella sp. PCHR]|uniref:Isoleucine--tRNA ligase n=1 Tax=Xylanibacter caecicola TaxID=2736294 RepID=A0ABX2B4E8_9BACT|nr:isoleucine--tRNA ligase [Xylanibacter caecicola]NPE25832.1 isoleucine--tRNA ligase [Xylanibacter caecicola]
MTSKFAEHNGLNLVETNKEVLASWNENDVFHKTISEREGCPEFVFFEGPPSANGHPGIHHVLARAIKDTFNRYKTMKGYMVRRKAGWDTHGLPVELGVEKELGITKADIDNHASDKYISVEDYNRKCRQNVMMYTEEWRKLTEEMGYFVDLDNPYITYDNKYIETLWWLLKQLYDKGLLYKGYTIQPYSPAAGTGLSSHELNQPGCYRDVKDTTATALFKVVNSKAEWKEWGTAYFAAWTTTPWTLPSNTALCVGPNIKYVALQTYNSYNDEKITVIMAEVLVNAYFKAEGKDADMEAYKHGDKIIPYRIVGEYTGKELVGMEYEQLMPWVKPSAKVDENAPDFVKAYAEEYPEKVFVGENGKDKFVEMGSKAFRVIPGDYVTTEDGTGIVHIAPTFGADDAKVAKDAEIPSLFLINKKGDTRPMVDLEGKYYVMDELDSEFAARCLNAEAYAKHAGDYVKNAYSPAFNSDGKYDEKAAMKAEDLNIVLCMEMKQEGTALKIEKHVHNYPHCWRTDKPVLYYPLDSWFIRSSAKKERMSELNKTINWQPESTGTGRFGNWLDNLNDWNLSRSRYWGTPLPIWRNEDGEEICIGSMQQLYDEIEKSVAAGIMQSNPMKDKGFVPGDYSRENYDKIDIHRPYVDNIVLVSDSGKAMKRESDLIDVWFDSGSMPYAQVHYPFENRELIDERKAFPADFINEGVDQTRGWFFTLHAIATMVFDSVAFKNVISTGLVLDSKGNKMSKHVGNVINPFTMIDKFGADPVRFYMMTNSEPWDNLKFDPNGVDEVRRKFFGTLYNTYSFFALYANVDAFDYSQQEIPVDERPEIDRWILSVLNTLIKGVEKEMDSYDPTRAGRLIDTFVNDDLSNWFVRLNRKRFWGKDMDKEKLSAYQTLYTCLETVAKLLAPFAPFYADRLYMDLIKVTGRDNVCSVHLAKYPVADESLIDSELEERMRMAQKITSMTLALRRKVNIKVRQPLQSIMIPAVDDRQKEYICAVKELIMNEVNVKELNFVEGSGVLVKKVKCNFRTLGKKFGKLMKSIAAGMENLTQEDIASFEQNSSIELNVEGQSVVVDIADVEIISEDIPGWLVANEGNLTVALEVEISDELRKEGMARELINRIQNIRKDTGLEITDRINVIITSVDQVEEAVEAYSEYIKGQVLADDIVLADNDGPEFQFDTFNLNIKVEKK